MIVSFVTETTKVEAVLTDDQNVGPDGWRHVMAIGHATTSESAVTACQSALRFLAGNRECVIRCGPDKPIYETEHHVWASFIRFSFRDPDRHPAAMREWTRLEPSDGTILAYIDDLQTTA